jgi:hypothetical protein
MACFCSWEARGGRLSSSVKAANDTSCTPQLVQNYFIHVRPQKQVLVPAEEHAAHMLKHHDNACMLDVCTWPCHARSTGVRQAAPHACRHI